MIKGSNKKWSIVAGLYGNAVEWYEFILYAYFAPLFAVVFFPSKDQFISLLATFGIFASGFLVRPLGGLLVGHYGDYAGRRKALIVSIILMTIATLLIALLPTYEKIGLLSPFFLVFLRLIQGVAIGGELTNSATFLVEHAPNNRRGFAGSLILSTAFLGMLMGSVTTTMITAIVSQEEVWRVGYFLGGLLGIVGIFLRVKSDETPNFVAMTVGEKHPAKQVIFYYRKQLLLAIIFSSVLALGNYILIAYATTFLVNFEGVPLKLAMRINSLSIAFLIVLIPLFGFLSDKIGRKNVLCIGLYGFIIFSFPIFWLLTSGNFLNVLEAEMLLSFNLASINAVVPIILIEMFPLSIRSTGTSIGYNMGQAIFGGTAPLISLLLINVTHNKCAPAAYLFICVTFALIATWLYNFRLEDYS